MCSNLHVPPIGCADEAKEEQRWQKGRRQRQC